MSLMKLVCNLDESKDPNKPWIELSLGVHNHYKYTKMYSDREHMLFVDDVFKVEVPLSLIVTANKLLAVPYP